MMMIKWGESTQACCSHANAKTIKGVCAGVGRWRPDADRGSAQDILRFAHTLADCPDHPGAQALRLHVQRKRKNTRRRRRRRRKEEEEEKTRRERDKLKRFPDIFIPCLLCFLLFFFFLFCSFMGSQAQGLPAGIAGSAVHPSASEKTGEQHGQNGAVQAKGGQSAVPIFPQRRPIPGAQPHYGH